MGNIFRNAYLTIATASIDSCHESFLSQNVDTLEIPFVSRIEPKAKGTYRLTANGNSDGKGLCILNTNDMEDISGPWKTRGWVFQEVAMSTRLLRFGRTMVILDIPEKGYEKLPTSFNVLQQGVGYSTWRNLVEEYSIKKLTYEKDTFPAISGLARFYAEHLEDQYLAGIWKNDLFISLFWYHPPLPYLERRSIFALIDTIASRRSYIAPSWSWAAIKDRIEFGTWGFHPYVSRYQSTSECNIIEAQCILEGLDPFGIVQSGYIILSAKVLRLRKDEFSFTPTPGWQKGHYDWSLNGQPRVMQAFLEGTQKGTILTFIACSSFF
ncbi:heterokaryon incompatibility [Fusarium beomiforme]|uniref:Heterokaryon incompatibility n=1 Tax=Fusarium beomiforme TaxID=44412 RepID=A0A9P5AD10_9HYPO|nr:heterokaryon incompatibility [Fusarium beomiforme]